MQIGICTQLNTVETNWAEVVWQYYQYVNSLGFERWSPVFARLRMARALASGRIHLAENGE
jgi:hypothetical protein